MKINLTFREIPKNIEKASAFVHIKDVSEADAPAKLVASHHITPFLVNPSVTIDVDLDIPADRRNLSIFARIDAETRENKNIVFLTTTTTPLPRDPKETVLIFFERVE